jgi:hypothetical protein
LCEKQTDIVEQLRKYEDQGLPGPLTEAIEAARAGSVTEMSGKMSGCDTQETRAYE